MKFVKKHKKIIIVIVSIVTIMVAALAVTLLVMQPPKQTPPPQATQKNKAETANMPPLYATRPGYKNSFESRTGNVADPMAFFFDSPLKKVATYKNNAVIDPCNILSIEDLEASGVKRAPQTLVTAFTRNFIDGKSQDAIENGRRNLFDPNRSNMCEYQVQPNYKDKRSDGNQRILAVEVFQPEYIIGSKLSERLRDFDTLEPLHGYNVYVSKGTLSNQASSRYVILKGTNGFALNLFDLSEESQKSLISKAFKHFLQEQERPSGHRPVKYDSPLLISKYVPACSLFDSDTVKQIFNAPLSPYISEHLPFAIAILDFQGVNGGKDNYINTKCTREVISDEYMGRSATIEVDSFMHDNSTTSHADFIKKRAKDMVPVSGIGDDAFTYKDDISFKDRPAYHLAFRIGRQYVNVSLSDQQLSEEQMQAGLRLFAQRALEKAQAK